MSSVVQKIVEERRWRILSFLAGMPGRSLNEDVILMCFQELGFPCDTYELNHDLKHLERHGCITTTYYNLELGRHLLVVKLTADGLKTQKCQRPVAGVATEAPL